MKLTAAASLPCVAVHAEVMMRASPTYRALWTMLEGKDNLMCFENFMTPWAYCPTARQAISISYGSIYVTNSNDS
jgi:hypothetical protein